MCVGHTDVTSMYTYTLLKKDQVSNLKGIKMLLGTVNPTKMKVATILPSERIVAHSLAAMCVVVVVVEGVRKKIWE